MGIPDYSRRSATTPITPDTQAKMQHLWTIMTQVKTVIIAYALAISINPASLGQPRDINPGLRAASWKFVQRVICIGTRGSTVEPRVCHKVQSGGSSLSFDNLHRIGPISAWIYVLRIIPSFVSAIWKSRHSRWPNS
jgi:hypothetical protein